MTTVTKPNFDNILHLIQELAINQKEDRLHLQETDRLLKAQSQATDRLLKEQFQAIGENIKETERLLKEQSAATDRKIKEVSTQIGHLTNRLGEFVEEMVRPAVLKLFRKRGVQVNQVLRNLIAYDAQGEKLSEVDLLAINTDIAIVVECKMQLTIDHVNDHLDRLTQFKHHFAQYANQTIFGAIASIVLPDDVARYAYRQGLFVLAQSGDAVIIRNDDKFRPKHW
ncbi:hypothetical protein TI05_01270 [Achromatium sp. WMS3]|nr:hypothetical protein TI05_01270 [Achromatium sp. WMS3]